MNERHAPVRVIAEAGVNHNGDRDRALALVDVAAEAGADMVKFQTFKAERIVSPHAPKAAYQQRTTGTGESQLDMVRRLELSEADHDAIIARCAQRGIAFLSTPFDMESIELLVRKGVQLGKVPSGEVTHKAHLQAMARAFPQVIMSTGMCTLDEVRAAVDVLLGAGASRDAITLLHCNTEYPTPMADVNLRAMRTLARELGMPVGYSDHTLGIEVPIAAVAMGATVIEKHFTLDRSLPGPDHAASLEPDELRAMVRAVRHIEQALGDGVKAPTPSEIGNRAIARRSIHITADLPAGTVLEAHHLAMLRPGDGISPMDQDQVLGRTLCRPLAAGARLAPTDLA
ncbi:MAG: N-acetylneuraminate synthase [Flavobacteriales bacterium]|jgi:N-acetylneuraminate synthase|nr:N-acetylneuraminate synthase [Flavobacteriales bacterium]